MLCAVHNYMYIVIMCLHAIPPISVSQSQTWTPIYNWRRPSLNLGCNSGNPSHLDKEDSKPPECY